MQAYVRNDIRFREVCQTWIFGFFVWAVESTAQWRCHVRACSMICGSLRDRKRSAGDAKVPAPLRIRPTNRTKLSGILSDIYQLDILISAYLKLIAPCRMHTATYAFNALPCATCNRRNSSSGIFPRTSLRYTRRAFLCIHSASF